MYESTENSSIQRDSWLNLDRIVQALELTQDLIVISLCLGLFGFMVLQIRIMFLALLSPLQFHTIAADILSLLILVELFRLLIIYLQEQRISIGVAVEVSIVSVLREVFVRGILETASTQVFATCAFLLVLGVLLVIRVWLPPTFDGIDPEHQVSQRHQQNRLTKEAAEHSDRRNDTSSPQNSTARIRQGL
jgi:uncharacterized membrane protein (DUF373 family)